MSNDFFTNNKENINNQSFRANKNLNFIIEETNENDSESKECDFCPTDFHKPSKNNLSRNFTDLNHKKRSKFSSTKLNFLFILRRFKPTGKGEI